MSSSARRRSSPWERFARLTTGILVLCSVATPGFTADRSGAERRVDDRWNRAGSDRERHPVRAWREAYIYNHWTGAYESYWTPGDEVFASGTRRTIDGRQVLMVDSIVVADLGR